MRSDHCCNISDSLPETQAKVWEYRDNRAILGWLINRRSQQAVEVYDHPLQKHHITRVLGVETQPLKTLWILSKGFLWLKLSLIDSGWGVGGFRFFVSRRAIDTRFIAYFLYFP